MTAVGIDLGTTNTVVACVRDGRVMVLADEQGNKLLPSVINFHPSGEVLVGHRARERRVLDAKNTIHNVKRLLGRPWHSTEVTEGRKRFPFELKEGPGESAIVVTRHADYTLPEVSSFVLRRAKAIAERATGEAVRRAVITVPANFNDLQRAATKTAAAVAGIEVVRILNEPTAAALAYGITKVSHERIAIYDFGGGTLDCSLLDMASNVFEVLATAGDSFLGGEDIDNAIAERMADRLLAATRFDARADATALDRLRIAAENVKIKLSSEPTAAIQIDEIGFGPHGVPLSFEFKMNRNEFDELIRPIVRKTFEVCDDAMAMSALRPSTFDRVILVGGSTRIPLVQREVQAYFGNDPHVRIHPEEVVAIGAAIQAAALTSPERRRSVPPAPQPGKPPVPIQHEDSVTQTLPRAPVETDQKTGQDQATSVAPTTQVLARMKSADGEDEETRRGPKFSKEKAWRELKSGPAIRQSAPRVEGGSVTVELPILDHSVVTHDGSTGVTKDSTTRGGERTHRATQPGLGHRSAVTRAVFDANEDLSLLTPIGLEAEAYELEITPAPSGEGTAPQLQLTSLQYGIQAGPPVSAPAPHALSPNTTAPWPAVRVPPSPSSAAPTMPELPQKAATETGMTPVKNRTIPLATVPPPRMHQTMPSPVLMDVTPRALVVETAGGFSTPVIPRNMKIPCERTRAFTTVMDRQTMVKVRVGQGEEPSFAANTYLGEVTLSGMRAASRGDITVEVCFEVDSDGSLQVSATELGTGNEVHATLQLVGVDPELSIEQMMDRSAQRIAPN